MIKRTFVLLYGISCYLFGVTSLLGWIAAMLGFMPFESGPVVYSGAVQYVAAAALMALFAVQHTIMARPSFKEKLTQIIPKAAERSTFVLATAFVLWAMLIFWPHMPALVWSVEGTNAQLALTGIAGFGFAYLFIATFAINHFELFGLQQVYRYFRGQNLEPVPFRERLMYRFDRHPIMTGALIGSWVTPAMTTDHLLFSTMLTIYIVIGVSYEERDLFQHLGQTYADYAKRVKSVVPTFGGPKNT